MVLGIGMHCSITFRAGVMFLSDHSRNQMDGLKKIKEYRQLPWEKRWNGE